MISHLEVLYQRPLLFILVALALGVVIVCRLVRAQHWRAILITSLAEMSVGGAIWPALEAIYQRPLVPFLVLWVGLAAVVTTAHRLTKSEGLRIFWLSALVCTLLGAAVRPVLGALFRQPLLVSLIVFAAGLATVYTLFELATSPRIIKQRDVRVALLCASVVALLAAATWPLFCSLLLFTEREYLLGTIPLLYAFPYCLGVALVLRPILTLVKIARERGASAAQTQFDAWRDEWHERIKSDVLPEEAIKKHREGRYWRHISKLLGLFETLAVAPQAALWILVALRFGKRLPFLIDFDRPFFVLSTLLAYLVANAHPATALLLSAYLFLVKLYGVTSQFDTHSGVLKKLMQDQHQPRLSDIAFAGAIIASSFGCIHYCISILNPSAYSRPLTAVDGLYFSVTTFATVGYGDIHPSRDVSKLACILEIASGCLVLLFGANLAMMVWFQKLTNGRAGPVATAAASHGGAVEAAPVSVAESVKATVQPG
jgi:hypothetical protein